MKKRIHLAYLIIIITVIIIIRHYIFIALFKVLKYTSALFITSEPSA